MTTKKQGIYSIFILILATIVNGCTTSPGFIREPVSDHGKRYRIARFSFLPPAGSGWTAIIHDDKERIAFNYYHDKAGYSGKIRIGTTNSYAGYTAQDIAEDIQYDYDHRDEKYVRSLDRAKNRRLARYAIDRYFERVNSVPKPSTQIVEVAGLTCAKSIDYKRELTPVAEYRTPTDGGVTRWTAYFCPVPSQPDLPPIFVGFSLTVAPGKPMLDMEAILKPLLDSIEVTHDPTPVVAEKRREL